MTDRQTGIVNQSIYTAMPNDFTHRVQKEVPWLQSWGEIQDEWNNTQWKLRQILPQKNAPQARESPFNQLTLI